MGVFPLKYLGLPVSCNKLLTKDLTFVAQKIESRLENGFNALASSGARSILIDSCLDSIPTYAMGFFLLNEGVHVKMDMPRARFFWEGVGESKKYHMVKWEKMCRPKEFGGMDFADTRVRNICLLSKWIYKLESGSNDLSCQILRSKYMGGGGFYHSSGTSGSQFWKSLHKIKHWFKMGSIYMVGNGRKTSFWDDVWLGECPLRIVFPQIYGCCEQQNGLVAEVVLANGLDLTFCRSFGPVEVREWSELGNMMNGLVLNEEEDKVKWAFEASGKFSTKSMYRFILNPGVRDVRMMDMWSVNCPLKQKNFLWLCFRGHIQTAVQLAGRGWPGSDLCVVCGEKEDVDHILFNCVVARYLWCVIAPLFNIRVLPRSRDEFTELFLKKQGAEDNKITLFWFAAFAWTIWLTRNERVFQHKVLFKPSSPLYRAFSLMLQWKPLVVAKRLMATKVIISRFDDKLRELGREERDRAGVG
jgi:hypothetical protein